MSKERWIPTLLADLERGLEAVRLSPEEIERRDLELAEFLQHADAVAMGRLGCALSRMLTLHLRARVQARAPDAQAALH
jgi:hypothetical protein